LGDPLCAAHRACPEREGRRSHPTSPPSLVRRTIVTAFDPGCLIVATCTARPDAAQSVVGDEVRTVWQRHLCYDPSREAHRLRQTATTVELDFATQTEEHGIFVTGTISVRWP